MRPKLSTTAVTAAAALLFTVAATGTAGAIPIVKTFTDLRHRNTVRDDADFYYLVVDPPNSVYTEARSINNSGDIVGYYRTYGDGAIAGFLLRGRTYTPIAIPGATNVFPMRINDAGVIVGTATAPDNRFHGFVIQGSACRIVDNPALRNTVITGINENGEYVGYSFDSMDKVTSFAGKLTDSTLTPLTAGNVIWDVNNSDSLAGHTQSNDASPVDHTLTNTETLVVADQVASRIPIEATSKAFGINNNNDVVGTYADPHAFLIHNGQIVTFDVPGADGMVGTQAFGINDLGRIVGVYQESTNDCRGTALHGFLAIPKTGLYTQIISGVEPDHPDGR